MYFIIGLILGIALTISSWILITHFIKKHKIHLINKYNLYDIKFKLVFNVKPSLFDENKKSKLVKTSEISVRISSESELEALVILKDIIHSEVDSELISINLVEQTQ
jgi:hypothetical protein